MKHITRRHAVRRAIRAGGAVAGLLGLTANGQELVGPSYMPAQPLKVIVPFPPGGRTGFIARRLVVALHEVLGETVELEHRIESPLAEIGTFSRLPSSSRSLLLAMVRLPRRGVFDITEDNGMLERLTPIAIVAREPLALVISTKTARRLGIDNLAQLMRYVRQHPGKLTISTGADGNSSYFAAELFKSMSRTYITRIVGSRNVPDLQKVENGDVDLMFESLHMLNTVVQAASVRLMGVTYSAQHGSIDSARLGLNKPVATLQTEPNLADYIMYDYHCVFAPSGLDPNDAQRVYQTVARAVSQPNYRAALQAAMAMPAQDSPAEFLALENEEEQRWRRARGRW